MTGHGAFGRAIISMSAFCRENEDAVESVGPHFFE
jgi:hypothetical protein